MFTTSGLSASGNAFTIESTNVAVFPFGLGEPFTISVLMVLTVIAVTLNNVAFVPHVPVEVLLHPAEGIRQRVPLLRETDLDAPSAVLGLDDPVLHQEVYLLSHPRVRRHAAVQCGLGHRPPHVQTCDDAGDVSALYKVADPEKHMVFHSRWI